ncbi:Hypothetical predicted protein [Mytilus galloprovincialis]|uniref:Uncharacterized protein n=1 Tax=Mytilus galloprovincialis TaxID=29158 RepID=A0A8B6BR09_MYTGA|nr:Hypothetical predicted protein [Mytilus galloprovincialis]
MKVSLLCVALVFIVTIQLAFSEDNAKKGIKKNILGNINKQGKSHRGERRGPGGFERPNEKSPLEDKRQRPKGTKAAHADKKLREKRNAFNERRRLIRDATLDVSEIVRQNLKENLQSDQKRNFNRKARDVKASKKLQDMVIKKVA